MLGANPEPVAASRQEAIVRTQACWLLAACCWLAATAAFSHRALDAQQHSGGGLPGRRTRALPTRALAWCGGAAEACLTPEHSLAPARALSGLSRGAAHQA